MKQNLNGDAEMEQKTALVFILSYKVVHVILFDLLERSKLNYKQDSH